MAKTKGEGCQFATSMLLPVPNWPAFEVDADLTSNLPSARCLLGARRNRLYKMFGGITSV